MSIRPPGGSPSIVEEDDEEEAEAAEAEEAAAEEEELNRWIGILRKILLNADLDPVDDIAYIEENIGGDLNFTHLSDEQQVDPAFIWQVYIRNKIIRAPDRQHIRNLFNNTIIADIGDLSEQSLITLNMNDYTQLINNILTQYNNLDGRKSKRKSKGKSKGKSKRRSKRRSKRKIN